MIGGAEIYRAAIGMRETRRVLLTRVRTEGGREFECDTFFPVRLGVEGRGGDGPDGDGEWVKRGKKEMREFLGGEGVGVVPDGVVTEGDVRWEVELWERERECGPGAG